MKWPAQIAIALWATSFALPAEAYILTQHRPIDDCLVPVAASLEPAFVPQSVVADLLDWIADATTYDVADTRDNPPEISFCSIGDIIPYEGDEVLVNDTLSGAYDLPNRRIILVRPWDPGDIRDRSVLLHELIHHVQLRNRGYECVQAPEWEAYKLQEAYLNAHGLASGFDWLQIYFLSQCPRSIHP